MKAFREYEMIPANQNPSYQIRKKDENYPHIRLLYKRIDPSKQPSAPDYIIEKTEIKPMRWVDFDFLFSGNTAETIHKRQVIGASELEIVHMPPRPMMNTNKVIETARDAEHKIKQGKKKATISDIEKMLE
jgi:hypothetical protein